MSTYGYKVVEFCIDAEDPDSSRASMLKKLNELGSQGWCVVDVTGVGGQLGRRVYWTLEFVGTTP